MVKLFARKRTYLGFMVFLLTEFLILWLWEQPLLTKAMKALLMNNGLPFEAFHGGLSVASFTLVLLTEFVAVLYLALVAGDLVAKEMEEGTIRMVLARPVSRTQLFACKALVGVTHTFLLMLFLGFSSLAFGLLVQGGLGQMLVFAPLEKVFAVYGPGEGLRRYLIAVLFISLAYQTVSALALMCSCMRLRPATATVLCLSVLYVDLAFRSIPMLNPYKGFFLSHHLSCWAYTMRYTPPWHSIATSMLVLMGLTLSFWAIGLAAFCTRDIKN
jgi:ABC-2 type transport system permease protein